jgi:hypothetical protein
LEEGLAGGSEGAAGVTGVAAGGGAASVLVPENGDTTGLVSSSINTIIKKPKRKSQ